ncbi:MAG: selenoneine biosynthesis selenosugar synthase SenB [Betaproteobacteria bacterium]
MPPSPRLPVIVIVTPSLADANNGNWRTAHRWQLLLKDRFKVIVQRAWPGESSQKPPKVDLLIALHARRSAESVKAFRRKHAATPIAVVLTGTDLYHDLSHDVDNNTAAWRTIDTANALVVLQGAALAAVPAAFRAKTRVIYQSARQFVPAEKPKRTFNCVVAGHLRPEKDPETIFRMVRLIPPGSAIRITHIGAPLDNRLTAMATKLAANSPNYQWLGALSHGDTRAAIKRAHLLIHPSVLEGGANVIAEALTAGTAVVSSDVPGNIGMLGKHYPGYFPVGDAASLLNTILRCHSEPRYFTRLQAACDARAPLFEPETERAALCLMIDSLLAGATRAS